MNKYIISPDSANSYIELIFQHLEKQLLLVGYTEPLMELPQRIKTAFVSAQLAAIDDFGSQIGNAVWLSDWYMNAKAWSLMKVFGEDKQSVAIADLEYTASSLGFNSSPFMACGNLAVRNLNESLDEGMNGEQWVERYEGTFATLVGLLQAVAAW